MNRADMIKEILHRGRIIGYSARKATLWKRCTELVVLIELQSSNWFENGLYINIGIIPADLMHKNYPPSSAYWACQLRVNEIRGEYTEVYDTISHDCTQVADELVASSIDWMFDWIARNLIDANVHRRALLQQDHSSVMAMFGQLEGQGIMSDWAHQQLKPAVQYWGYNSRYFDSER